MQKVIDNIKAIYENSQNALAILDSELNVVWYNDEASKFFPVIANNINIKMLMHSVLWINALILLRSGSPVYIKGKNTLDNSISAFLEPVIEDEEFMGAICHISNKCKSGDLCANVMAHDIKNAIYNILRASKLFNKDKLTSLQHDYLDLIINNANNAIELANSIIDFSDEEINIEANKREPSDMNTFLRGLIKQYNIVLGNMGIKINLVLPYQTIFCKINTRQIENAISNLISNAIRYYKNTIIVELSLHNDKSAIISIKDDGVGIAKEIKEYIFCPCVKANSPGSGIGLFSASIAVQQNEGKLVLSDDPNFTHFKMYLPIYSATEIMASGKQVTYNNEYIKYILTKAYKEKEMDWN